MDALPDERRLGGRPTFQWGEVDGVPTVSAAEGAIQGPLQACLMFGAGRSDETMTVSGINHIVEHLALHPLETTTYSWNGQVGSTSTRFSVSGRAEEVVEFFSQVAAHLSDLPVHRLAHELRVLAVEGDNRGPHQLGFDLSLRLGPRGAGLLGWPEHGLRRLEADEVCQWARTWFTAQNAVLWTSGPIPAGLNLLKLPQGDPPVRPMPPPVIVPARSWVRAKTRTASLSMVSGQLGGVVPVMAMARQRAFDRLRRRDAISYSVDFTRLRIGGGQSLEYLAADGTEGSYRQILAALVNVVEELADSGPNVDELSVMRRLQSEALDHPQGILQHLDSSSERRLLGLPFLSPEELQARLGGQTPEQLREELTTIIPTMFAIAPEEIEEDLPGWSVYYDWSSDRVQGQEFLPIEGREKGSLVLGPDGVSWVLDSDRYRTVRWDETVACFTWDDGRRHLLGPTGSGVAVTPWNWQRGQDLASSVDDAIDGSRRIRMGEGATQYLRDPIDASSVADVRWLGTLVGVRYLKRRVDVVIDTDGLFILHRQHQREPITGERLQALRSLDRGTLLAMEPANRWIPESEIDDVELMTPRATMTGAVGRLVLRTTDGERLKITLDKNDQMDVARSNFRRAFGTRFRPRSC